MPIINSIAALHPEMTAWRQDLHAHPELSMQESRTSAVVRAKLAEFGVDEIITGMATHGVVGVIRAGSSGRAIGLRADMDALPIHEETGLPYASLTPSVMHACGHDGHTTMLLGAAKYLAETRNFDGTVYLIFQPAEEFEGGAERMVQDGLFERCPMEKVYGLHNWPETKAGTFLWRTGPVMAAVAFFEIDRDRQGQPRGVPASGDRSDRGLGADHRGVADDRFALNRSGRERSGFDRSHLGWRGVQYSARAGDDEGDGAVVPGRRSGIGSSRGCTGW